MNKQKPTSQRTPQAFDVPEMEPKTTAKAERSKSTASASKTARKPKAVPTGPKLKFEETDENFFAAVDRQELMVIDTESKNPRKSGGFRLGSIAFGALGFLITASIGLWLQDLVTSLFAENTWLGWAALGASAILALALVVFLVREITSILKLRSTAGLRQDIETALKHQNSKDINRLIGKLESHFSNQPKTAHGRAVLKENRDEVMDAIDRFALAELELLEGLDTEAKQLVLNASKRVSVVTAVSPRAVFDIGYVLFENVRLIRKICELYGGRTGFVGTLSLLRRVITHLAVTGTVSLGEGMVQQLLGQGLAAKLSARLGEGVINGVMTARIGLSAMDICRPAPYHELKRPKLSNFISAIAKVGANNDEKSNEKPAK